MDIGSLTKIKGWPFRIMLSLAAREKIHGLIAHYLAKNNSLNLIMGTNSVKILPLMRTLPGYGKGIKHLAHKIQNFFPHFILLAQRGLLDLARKTFHISESSFVLAKALIGIFLNKFCHGKGYNQTFVVISLGIGREARRYQNNSWWGFFSSSSSSSSHSPF